MKVPRSTLHTLLEQSKPSANNDITKQFKRLNPENQLHFSVEGDNGFGVCMLLNAV